jgi:hypothetical protein
MTVPEATWSATDLWEVLPTSLNLSLFVEG